MSQDSNADFRIRHARPILNMGSDPLSAMSRTVEIPSFKYSAISFTVINSSIGHTPSGWGHSWPRGLSVNKLCYSLSFSTVGSTSCSSGRGLPNFTLAGRPERASRLIKYSASTADLTLRAAADLSRFSFEAIS